MSINNNIIIFDLDKTITKIDTYAPFLIGLLILRPRKFFKSLVLPVYFLMYKLKKISDTDLKLKFLETIACGLDKEFIESYSEFYIKFSKAFNYKKKALKRIRYHRELGERCILASASFDFYVMPMGFELGFSDVIATKSVWSNNKLLPLIDGNNLKGIFKLNEIKKLVGENSVDKTVTVYTDHIYLICLFSNMQMSRQL